MMKGELFLCITHRELKLLDEDERELEERCSEWDISEPRTSPSSNNTVPPIASLTLFVPRFQEEVFYFLSRRHTSTSKDVIANRHRFPATPPHSFLCESERTIALPTFRSAPHVSVLQHIANGGPFIALRVQSGFGVEDGR